MKQLLPLLLAFLPILVFSQDVDRIVIPGVIKAPAGEDVEAVSVYNSSSGKGTITNAEGEFSIEVAVNDRLQITALQYKRFTIIVTKEDLLQKELSIYLNPFVNKLEEVIVRSTDLSGYAELDAKNIQTHVYIPDWDLSLDAVRFGYDFERDRFSKIEGNVAEAALKPVGVPLLSADLVKLSEIFFPKKKKSKKAQSTGVKQSAAATLLERYESEYLSRAFAIPADKVVDFAYFVEDNGLTKDLLKPENEIRLLAFLLEQSARYKDN